MARYVLPGVLLALLTSAADAGQRRPSPPTVGQSASVCGNLPARKCREPAFWDRVRADEETKRLRLRDSRR